ncbi:MAG TPA: hypothetical protein VKU87_04905 [Thermomicrobiaceae bacterium]|nr:hypothetical protein [Thermomicrobiaceae bacterium]
MKPRTAWSATALVLALIASAVAPVAASATTYHPWYDDVSQTPTSLGLAVDGSYGFIDLHWRAPDNLDVAKRDGTRVADGLIDERVCWGYVPGHDYNPEPFCGTSGSKWTIVGQITLTFASPVADNLGSQWSVVKAQTRFSSRWRRYNRKRAGSPTVVGETPGTTYGYLVGTNGDIPEFSPAPITAGQYHADVYDGASANCLVSAYTPIGQHGWATTHTYTVRNMSCSAAASALARGHLTPNTNAGLVTPGFTCRVLNETFVKDDPEPIHELVSCLEGKRAFTVSLNA